MHSFIAKTNGVEPDNNSEVEKCVQNLVMRYLLPYKNNGWQRNSKIEYYCVTNGGIKWHYQNQKEYN